MITRLWPAALLAIFLAGGCAQQDAEPSALEAPHLEAMPSPASPGSMGPNLAASPKGEVYLSWMERDDSDTPSLRYAKLSGSIAQWSSPTTVVAGEDLFVNWADFPSILPTRSGRLVAHWLRKSGDAAFAYDTWIAQSDDDGRTWSEGAILHDDGLQAEHGFVSLLESPSGSVEAIWLDGRNTVAPTDQPEMQLAFTTISSDGAPDPTQLIDTRICDCCQTSAAWTAAGPVVAYRDRSPEEIRDISIIRRVDGAWSDPASVHADNWWIEGCPVNGPSIAASDINVAIAWFTGAGDKEQVKIAFSDDSGETFSDPVRVDDGDPVGRVSVAVSQDGRAHVAWLERVGEDGGAEIRVKAIERDRAPSDALIVGTTSAASAGGFPRMVAEGDGLVIAWTEALRPSQVRVARIRTNE